MMPEIDSPETARRIFRASRMWILERTVGVYAQELPDGNPRLEGSGVLLQIADAYLVLSASHVMKATSKGSRVMLGPMTPDSRMVLMPHVPITFTADVDRVDVGFARLPGQTANELKAYGKKFLSRADLDLRNEPARAFYSVVGYPAKTNTPNHQAKRVDVLPFCYATYLYDRDDADSTPGVSIVVRFNQDTITHPNGEVGRMPSLKGISGCGIWRLYGDGDRLDRLDTWDAGWIRLAGIEHGCVERKYIRGTMVGTVLDLIERQHADLRTSMQITVRA
jgi:hypothetical protein